MIYFIRQNVSVVLASLVLFFCVLSVAIAAEKSAVSSEGVQEETNVLSPKDVITQSLDAVRKEVAENAESAKIDNTIVKDILDKNVMPYISSKTIAKGVMGRYFRMTSTEQRNAFLKKFESSLISTYASGLGEIGNVSYTVEEVSNDGKKAKVLMKAKLDSGSDVPVIFSFKFSDKDNKWYGVNLDVAGINLGLAYRDKFAEDMVKYKNNIDLVIENWNSNITE